MRTKLKITEGIFPMPVLMVATYNEDGSVNVMNAAWGTMHYDTEDIPAILAIPDTLFFLPAFPFSDYCLKRRKVQSATDRPKKS